MTTQSAEDILSEALKKLDEMKVPENLRPRALDYLLTHKQPAKTTPPTAQPLAQTISTEGPATADLSLEDFIKEKNPRRYATEEIPCILYWAERYDSKPVVNEEDILSYYRISGVHGWPARLDQSLRDLSSKKKYGMLEVVPGRQGFFQLTRIGRHFVEVKLTNRNA